MLSDDERLPEPYIVPPAGQDHYATVFLLHGFTMSGERLSRKWVPAIRQRLGAEADRLRFVFLNAPVRAISCYGTPMRREHAWHDYFTDHGGDEGHPEIEEEVDLNHIESVRAQLHHMIDAEAARSFGGDYSRVALAGWSQGACTALDAALTLPPRSLAGRACGLAGVYSGHGHVYSCSATSTTARGARGATTATTRVHAFHSASDNVIAASLALSSYANLLDSGAVSGAQLRLHVEPVGVALSLTRSPYVGTPALASRLSPLASRLLSSHLPPLAVSRRLPVSRA